MNKYLPAGWNEQQVMDGLHKAMRFGQPTRSEDMVAFYFPKITAVDASTAVDEDGIPFDPAVRPKREALKKVDLPCAYEFSDQAVQDSTAGDRIPSKVVITLLDPGYQQVRGFAYVAIAGERYHHSFTEPPVALGSIDVWTVHCVSEWER